MDEYVRRSLWRSGLSRREFIARGGSLAGLSALGLGADLGPLSDALAATLDPRIDRNELLSSFVADATGNGTPSNSDKNVVRRARGSKRRYDVRPAPGYDFRADVFGRGRVDDNDLRAVKQTLDFLRQTPLAARPRPVTVCWHYAWYGHAKRRPIRQHVWFKGGGYSSRDPETEGLFNDLKNEFGITVDAVSWADPTADRNLNNNFRLGYKNAPNARTRHAALLYESLISLRATNGERIDFAAKKTRDRLVEHFRGMARTFKEFRDDSKLRIFRIDGRPVIFLYASHMWGLDIDGKGPQYDHIDAAMENAIEVFRKVYGARPFVIGEEMAFIEDDWFDEGRQRRSANFDGVFLYHHAADADFIIRGGQELRAQYADAVREVLTKSYEARNFKSRFTNKHLLVVPSLAAGHSKDNVPTLHTNRTLYADFLKEMIRFHEDNYLMTAFGPLAPVERPAIFSIGGWNEEWEGHAVMPARFNRTLAPRSQEGFDLVMAIKQAFGWNHYAEGGLDIAL